MDLTTTGTVPANTSLTITVYEDVGADGSGANTDPNGKSYDNSATESVADGTNTYSLTGLDGSSGNEYWLEVVPGTSDLTETATLTEATLGGDATSGSVLTWSSGALQTTDGGSLMTM